jgi:hypothetical protein
MQVFISWSGARSKAVAELLDEWLQCVLQAIHPWMSSKDIDRGSLWFAEITDQLKDTKIGIICLTKDNLNKPWILFESGALAKGLSSSRVCTFLIDLNATEVGNPLAQFNHTLPSKEGVYDLVRTLNSSLGDQALREKVLGEVFDTYWPKFELGFENALKNNPIGDVEPIRSEESIQSEILETLRSLDRRIRTIEGNKVVDVRPRVIDEFPMAMTEHDYHKIKSMVKMREPIDKICMELKGRYSMKVIDRTIMKLLQEETEERELDS